MGRDGVVTERTVVPRVFDPHKPHSLLGCIMCDTCPARYLPHPALRGHKNAASSSGAAGDGASNGASHGASNGGVEAPNAFVQPVGSAMRVARAARQ